MYPIYYPFYFRMTPFPYYVIYMLSTVLSLLFSDETLKMQMIKILLNWKLLNPISQYNI